MFAITVTANTDNSEMLGQLDEGRRYLLLSSTSTLTTQEGSHAHPEKEIEKMIRKNLRFRSD